MTQSRSNFASSKRSYLALCLAQPLSWLIDCANHPSAEMRPIHVALVRIAVRRNKGALFSSSQSMK